MPYLGFYLHFLGSWSASQAIYTLYVRMCSCADSGFSSSPLIPLQVQSPWKQGEEEGGNDVDFLTPSVPRGANCQQISICVRLCDVCFHVFSHVMNMLCHYNLCESSHCSLIDLFRDVCVCNYRFVQLQSSWLHLISCQSWAAQCVSGSGVRMMRRNPRSGM